MFKNIDTFYIAPFYHSRRSECKYYSLCFYQNFLNVCQKKFGKETSNLCRFCKEEVESVFHILIKCKNINHQIIRQRCTDLKCDFIPSVLLSKIELKVSVEKFLITNFKI